MVLAFTQTQAGVRSFELHGDQPNFQILKIFERFLKQWLSFCFERFAFGEAQFAYRKKHGDRDAVLYYALS